MKRIKSFVVRTLWLVLAASLLGGCASTGYQKAEVTSRGITDARKELTDAQKVITQTVASLNDLVNNPQPDLRPQYQKFASGVDDLSKRTQKARDRATDMEGKRDAYIKNWQEQVSQIQNPKIKQDALNRIDAVRKEFATLKTLLADNKEVYTPFFNNLRDIQRYLGSDLTMGGINSIKSQANKVAGEEPAVQKSLDKLVAELDKISQAISPTNTAAQ